MRVAILGCGYVGLATGHQLKSDGHGVVGVRRSEAGLNAIEDAGFEGVQADMTDPEAMERLPEADWLIFAASVGRDGSQSARELYVETLERVVTEYASRSRTPTRLVYTSSTGVYGDHGGEWVDEDTPPRPSGQRGETLLEAEEIALDTAFEHGIEGTVLRFGGLYGPGRYRLERYLNRPITEGYRNATHRRDAAGAIAYILTSDVARDTVVLVVDNEPVEKHAFVEWLAKQCGESPPPCLTLEERLASADLSTSARDRLRSNKRCRNDRLRSFGYELAVPTVWEGYRPAIEAFTSETDVSR